jgi:hypothetical protein
VVWCAVLSSAVRVVILVDHDLQHMMPHGGTYESQHHVSCQFFIVAMQ